MAASSLNFVEALKVAGVVEVGMKFQVVVEDMDTADGKEGEVEVEVVVVGSLEHHNAVKQMSQMQHDGN